MDMMGHDMSSQETPANINEPYAKNLITIIASVIAFLTVRHVFIYIFNKTTMYSKLENKIINTFSYTALNGASPPLGALLVVLALISAVLPLLLLNVDLAVNSNRAGFLCLVMVPFLLSSTGKNSAISLLTGISSIKLNFLHRILGMALFICATVHMSTMIYAWSKFPAFLKAELALTKVQYGLAGYGCLCVVILGSIWPVRLFCYEAFVATHILGIAFIGCIAVHTPYAMRYFFSGLVCYLLNLLAVWFVKTYVAHARFEILPEGCTKVSIRLASPIKTHHIGQYINLCIPSISPFQWHPFTITSVQQSNAAYQNSIEVCVCSRGNFTRSLYKCALPDQDMRVFVSGPFGSKDIQAARVLDTYSSVVIASGGSGVTFGMRLLRELTDTLVMQQEQQDDNSHASLLNHNKTKDIYFFWCVRRPLEIGWFRQELEQINYLYHAHDQFPNLHIKFHITAGETHGMIQESALTESSANNKETIDSEDATTANHYQLGPRKDIDVVYGCRFDAQSVLASANGDVGAFVCGPTSFNASFKNQVALHRSNVHLHCESFSY
ncbi:60S ribosomal protein L20B [Mucor velutinosus]|uniref:ferric-chelate reductase (NADPH) n=1 Tax=Mucor velutinosus TaxID=708070 RepID=A0AAN7DCJ8_9FUNG|nr:60S ribosomal protein L20B [Mucor velutinosus]